MKSKIILCFVLLLFIFLGIGFYVYKSKFFRNQSVIIPATQPENPENFSAQPDTVLKDKVVDIQLKPEDGPVGENKTAPPQNIPETKPAQGSPDLKIISQKVSWGFEKYSGERAVDTIIFHSSYNALGGNVYNIDKLLEEYKSYGVSPHYLIDRGGNVYSLVDENNIAYHAGEGKTPDGRSGVNKFSIGIEIMNTKNEAPDAVQYQALNQLIISIKSRHKIKYVLGHSQIAPGRKDDPWNFDWSKVKK